MTDVAENVTIGTTKSPTKSHMPSLTVNATLETSNALKFTTGQVLPQFNIVLSKLGISPPWTSHGVIPRLCAYTY